MRHHPLARIAPLAASAVLLATGVRAQGMRPDLQPRDDVSVSGAWTLHVDPSAPTGAGRASYRLVHGDQTAWEKDLPYTLWESVVGDDGAVAGYAYGCGVDGFCGESGAANDFRVVLLDATGAPRLERSVARTGSSFLHCAPNPLAQGLVLVADDDRFLVRVADPDVNRSSETWWTYRLSDGGELGQQRPKETLDDAEAARFALKVVPVRGTPLVLAHWWTFHDGDAGEWYVGGRFSLHDREARCVWTLDLPRDYEVAGDEDTEEALQGEVRRDGCILDAAQAKRFTLRLVAEKQRATFEVAPDPAAERGWRVREVAREEFRPAAPPGPAASASAAALTELPVKDAEVLAEIGLAGTGTGSKLGRIFDFDLDDQGRFGFANGERRFVLVSPEGAIERETALPPGGHRKCVWLQGPRWLVCDEGYGGDARSSALWLDAASGALTPIEDFDCPPIEAADGTGDGGFVVLAKARGKYTTNDFLRAFDAQGRLRWSVGQDYEDEAQLFSPEDLAVSTTGTVGVLDNIKQSIQLFDPSGTFVRAIDLGRSFGAEPNYPSDLGADADGGWVVHDFEGHPPVWRLDGAGQVRAKFQPVLPDGRAFAAKVRGGPRGSLWSTDDYAFVELDPATGKALRTVGGAADPDALQEVESAVLDVRGRLLVGDARTGAVHVFDRDGKRQFLCQPAADDAVGCEELAGTSDGRIFAGGEHGFVVFGPAGERLGKKPALLGGLGESWFGRPADGRRWAVCFKAIALVDEHDQIVRRIERRPDGTWLAWPNRAAVGPDGALAAVDESSLLLYAANGDPVKSWKLPEGFVNAVAFDGARAVIAIQERLVTVDVKTGATQAWRLPRSCKGFGGLGFVAGSKDLWAFPYEERRLLRVRLGP